MDDRFDELDDIIYDVFILGCVTKYTVAKAKRIREYFPELEWLDIIIGGNLAHPKEVALEAAIDCLAGLYNVNVVVSKVDYDTYDADGNLVAKAEQDDSDTDTMPT